MTTAERFFDKVSPEPNSGCWLWTGYCRTGYGQFKPWHRPPSGAHRYSYELHKGPIPAGLEIDHLCRVRCCVNPAHLEAVTRAENNTRAAAAITHCPTGHAYAGANLYITPSGTRACITCNRRRTDEARARKRAA